MIGEAKVQRVTRWSGIENYLLINDNNNSAIFR